MRLTVMALATTLALSGCGDDGSGVSLEATQLAFTVQPSSSAAGQAIAPAVQVSVQDASGTLVSNAENPVTLALGLNPSGAALGGTRTVNAAGGVANFSDLQIDKPGTGYTFSASATDLTAATSAAFDVTEAPGVAISVAPVAGAGSTVTVGQPVQTAPSVKVTDGFGDPVSGVGVTFSVALGGGSASGTDQSTDAVGVATVGQWTLGTVAGPNVLLATVPGLEGSPVTFTATATSGAAATLTKHAGDNQTTTVGAAVPTSPAVLVTDSYENPVADVPVTFAVTSGAGSLTGASQTTGSDGIATVGSWILGSSPGANNLRASAAGLAGSTVTFSATAEGIPMTATVEVRNHFFRSLRNGSGSEFTPTPFGEPAVDTIAVGGTVTWQWIGQGHNVTPYQNSAFTESGTHDTPFTFGPITFNSRGRYRYRCTNHSSVVDFLGLVGMRGEIVVR